MRALICFCLMILCMRSDIPIINSGLSTLFFILGAFFIDYYREYPWKERRKKPETYEIEETVED